VVERDAQRLRLGPLLLRVAGLLSLEAGHGGKIRLLLVGERARILGTAGERHAEMDARAVIRIERADPRCDLAIDAGAEVRKLVEPRLLRSPVVLVVPVLDQLAQVVDRNPVLPTCALDLVGEASPCQAAAQVLQDRIVDAPSGTVRPWTSTSRATYLPTWGEDLLDGVRDERGILDQLAPLVSVVGQQRSVPPGCASPR
jgi:hypothetical protein